MNTFTKTFITTTLPYVNSNPHVGHAFEFILGDAIARYLRTKTDVHFNIGLDEHGLKVWSKSQELGLTTESYIDNLTKVWLDFCHKFGINYDSFYKTSDKEHHRKVKIIWNRFLERGDIYKKQYKGNYCIGCESFKLDKELENGICPQHTTTKIQVVEEENYFFKITKYKDNLIKWINNNPNFLQPQSKLEELKNLIENGEDLSISRLKSNCPWGIEVPNDSEQIIYIWFEALLNYVFSAGYLTDNFNWNSVIQLCGPDNLRFQGFIFQSILEAEGIKKTDKLLVHGTILDKDGRKMSKSIGNVVDPIEQLEKWGLEAVKYYTLCGLNTYSDSGWNEEDLVRLYNNDICNDWGNLISRTLHLIDTKSVIVNPIENDFKTNIDRIVEETDKLWSEFKVKEAIIKTNELVKLGNKYINDEKPWSNDNYSDVLNNLHYLLSEVNKLYLPVFPTFYPLVDVALKNNKKVILFNKIT